MCELKRYNKTSNTQIDECMREIIKKLNAMDIKTYASCCGHKKYPTTIIVRNNEGAYWDYMSGKVVPRTRRFYSKDDDGYYYIREVVNK